MEPADAVLRFLESVSPRAETEFYLGLFRALPRERFAAISVDADVARHAMEAVVLDLRFLATLGLVPLVVLGLFESTESQEQANRLERRLLRAQVPCRLLSPDQPDLISDITAAARAGVIPVIAFGKDDGGAAGVDARVARLGRWLSALATRKMIFLHRRGALKVAGAPLEVVNLTVDAESLLASRDLSKKQRLLVSQSRKLVFELVSHRLLVSITSPFDLLRELFTVKGAGTLLRRGAVIERHAGVSGLDGERLRSLLAKSFGRGVAPAFLDKTFSNVYLEENYRGAAILVDTPLGAYLTKFAVEREAQGEGMGRDLWARLLADHPTVFWRARRDNPIDRWYVHLCDGLTRFADWTVYWKGLAPERIPEAISFALGQPVDLIPV